MKKIQRYYAAQVMFTSDTHFGHANIIKYCKRPFADKNHMDEVMIEKWNACIRPDHIVFHLGDFALARGKKRPADYLERLNGQVILIKGNHDHRKVLKDFEEVHERLEIIVNDQQITLSHYRMDVWPLSHRGAWHLHGHSHGTRPPRMDAKVIDIGVDCHNFWPLTFPEVAGYMAGHGSEADTVREDR